MSEHGNDDATARTASGVRPWLTLASLGVTENDLTTVHHGPPAAHRFLSAPVSKTHLSGTALPV